MQAGALRRPPAPLAGDDLVMLGCAAQRARDDRLDDAALAQRNDEFVEFGIGKVRRGLRAFGRNEPVGTRRCPRGRSTENFPADLADQRGKAAPQSRSRRIFRHRRFSQTFSHATLRLIIRRIILFRVG